MANGGEAGSYWWGRVRRILGLAETPAAAFQNIRQVGSKQIAVQAINSVVTIGAAEVRLVLERRHAHPRPVKSEVDLLRPEVAATVLVGREEEVAILTAWLDEAEPLSVHAIVARGGAGKTRLGLRLCEIAETMGWKAGLVSADELLRLAEHERLGDPDTSTLVVVDYAARSARSLNKVLRALAGQERGRHRFRFLLLERHGNAEGGWWSEIRQVTGGSDDRILDWFTSALPTALQTIDAVEDRRVILQSMLQAMVENGLAAKVPEVPAAGAAPAFDKALADDRADREPLFLMMAALFGAAYGVADSLALGRLDLALWVAIRERDRLKALASSDGINEALLPHLVACITLCRGVGLGDLGSVIEEERAVLGLESGVARDQVQHSLEDALPILSDGDGRRLGFLEPDVVGESFCLLLLTGLDATAQSALVRRCAERGLRRTAMQLVLIIQDYARELRLSPTRDALARRHPELAKLPAWLGEANPALGWLRGLAKDVDNPFQLLEIADQIPPQTLLLREVASDLGSEFVRAVRALGEGPIVELLQEPYALALNNLGNRLSALGRREAALAAAEEAVGVYRTLARDRPDAFLPGLAMSLNNFGGRLSALGRREPALDAAEEAVAIYRTLARDRPDAFLPDLAMSLNNLGGMLSELGRREPALDAAEEAVAICRTLARDRPDAFLPDLATSLNNLGGMLSALGRREPALDAAEEAVAIYRTLARDRPDAFLPDLATSLSNLGGRLSALGRREPALDAAEEAVAIRRTLARDRPDAFLPGLARSLGALGSIHRAADDHGRAAEVFEEGVRLLEAPFLRLPQAFVGLVGALARAYLGACETLGREPDVELLGPIAMKLHELQQQESHKGG